jgi:hypothetical protein
VTSAGEALEGAAAWLDTSVAIAAGLWVLVPLLAGLVRLARREIE